ncbi:MAG: hypothetical protein WC460_03865 [Patescibacteria group bacterium]
MQKTKKTKLRKVIIGFIAVFFVVNSFSAILIFNVEQASAQDKAGSEVGVTAGIPVTNQAYAIERFLGSVTDELKAVFFKNILGNLLNKIASQTATWIATGAKGKGPYWITNLKQFTTDYAQGAITDMVVESIKNVTGINICEFDPRMAIDLALQIPMFPEYKGYQPNCDYTKLKNHWDEIGKSNLLTFNYSITAGGEFQKNSAQLSNSVSVDRTLLVWDKSLLQYLLKLSPCEPSGIGEITCVAPGMTENPEQYIKSQLQQIADALDTLTGKLASDVELMTKNAQLNTPVQLYVGSFIIQPERINDIKDAWNKEMDIWVTKANKINDQFSKCQNKTREQLLADPNCVSVLIELGFGALDVPGAQSSVLVPDPAAQTECQIIAGCMKADDCANIPACTGGDPICPPECTQADCKETPKPLGCIRTQNCQDCLDNIDDCSKVPARCKISGSQAVNTFQSEVTAKTTYVAATATSLISGFNYLKTQMNDNLNPANFEGGAAYSAKLAQGLFDPQANQFNTYKTLYEQMAKEGLGTFAEKQLQATVNQGWKNAEDKISGYINTPAELLKAKAVEDLTKNDTSLTYTKSIIADSLGVFLKTLWNKYMQKLLSSLSNSHQEQNTQQSLAALSGTSVTAPQSSSDQYTQRIISAQGVENYITKLAQQFTVNFSFKDVDLLSAFQTNLSGEVNPDLYNNVIDQNLAQAINDKLTIKEALAQNKLIGTYTFSWNEKADLGTYNLANLKKLRKARVIPLGLELAAELVRDCNYRQDLGADYAQYKDLDFDDTNFSNASLQGYSNTADPLKYQRLRNCLFKPLTESTSDAAAVRNYNSKRLNESVKATLAEVVSGFDKSGTGACGGNDLDEEESPFCNLVNPNWVLKLPVTKCSLPTEAEPYGEILQSNNDVSRYSHCPDFASCLQDDGKGGCVGENYGFCVKEKNVWQFNVNTCPADFNSCQTFKTDKSDNASLVSYLKNTLSGSDVCSAANAGCTSYLTKTDQASAWKDPFVIYKNRQDCETAGFGWLAEQNVCDPSRIYLNRNVNSCVVADEGCHEFMYYRNPTNNLLPDSSFEFAQDNTFPAHWDLLLQSEVSQDICTNLNDPAKNVGCQREGNCGYIKTCLNYNYKDKALCSENNGQWFPGGFCSDGSSPDQAACAANSGQWLYCVGGIKANAEKNDCANNAGQFREYCLTSLLKYNLCSNPQYDNQAACTSQNGTWHEECQKGGQVVTNLLRQDDCEDPNNGGTWVSFCQGAQLYNSTKAQCQKLLGAWQGEGPFTSLGSVSKNGNDTEQGLGKLQINIGSLTAGQELRLIYKNSFSDTSKVLTKAGDVYTASVYIKSDQALSSPIIFSLIGGQGESEISSNSITVGQSYEQVSSTLITSSPGNDLELRINLPAEQTGANIFIDTASLIMNSLDQVRSYDFVQSYQDYDLNSKVYYKKPAENLSCHGYGPNDPPPKLESNGCSDNGQTYCENTCNGYWDGTNIYSTAKFCYQYAPDNPSCSNFMKMCEPEEVGCQMYTPVNGDPSIPGVVSLTDYCPAECVGFQTYKQDPTLYEPEPDPLFNNFISETATSCTLDEVGCSQFTNLDSVAQGGEGIEYYSYIRQCIKPNLGLGEKTFFTWQSSASGPPQLVKYQYQSDKITGAPKTIDNSGDCTISLGAEDFNCIKFFDSAGIEYYRDNRKTITVADDCHPYRKTESTQANCVATNGRWQADINACLYDAIPSEGLACSAASNNCRAYVGNRGNNVYFQIYDTFENGQISDWFTGTDGTGTEGLLPSSESLVLGGHSLSVANSVREIHKSVSLAKGNLYTLSFWAKTDNSAGNNIGVKFNAGQAKSFAAVDDKKVALTTNWKNYNLGPILIDWDPSGNDSLNFSGLNSKIYLDNIVLKVVKDNVYVVKNSWNTPDSCNQNFFGAKAASDEIPPMLGCQAYTDTLGQTHNLKSFTSLCRSSAVGCQLLIDTQNSTSPNQQIFNGDNASYLDDYTVSQDQLAAYILNDSNRCTAENKGCQKLGLPSYGTTGDPTFSDKYLKNDPNLYVNAPNSIMCSEESLGCSELINESGTPEYYKIDQTKLCEFKTGLVAGVSVDGWFKKGSATLGCGSLPYDQANCPVGAGVWSEKYNQCVIVLNDVTSQDICVAGKGEWLGSKCLANPFTIYKIAEANKYNGYVGICENKWNGCTQFTDVNPNFVANNSFETTSEGALLSWNSAASESLGIYRVVSDRVQEGNNALQLIKRTEQNASGDTYGFGQTIYRLEKGKTYKVSFYYRVPAEASGRGESCLSPSAAFSFNSSDGICSNPNHLTKETCTATETWKAAPQTAVNYYNAEGDWKKVEVLYSVPLGICSTPGRLTQADCLAGGGSWQDLKQLQDYKLVLYAPANANCPDSYVLYDQVEVKDYQEDSYYVIDQGDNLDRSSCNSINWDSGCVQFLNSNTNSYEIIQVANDRNCEEWAVCTSHCSDTVSATEADCKANGQTWNASLCTATNLCTQGTTDNCTAYAPKKDNVRYGLDSAPLDVKRISDFTNQQGYIYRYGAGPLSQLTEWRAGDYSGYTIPDRLPIEEEISLAPDQQFKTFQPVNDLGTNTDDRRYTEAICKIFPSADSPVPYVLSQQPGYENLKSLYSQTYGEKSMSFEVLQSNLNKIGTGCFYAKAEGSGVTTYVPRLLNPAAVCTSPLDLQGKVCEINANNCKTSFGGIETDACSNIEKVTEFNGLEGMCLEFDTLNPLFSTIYKDLYKSLDESENLTGSDYQPYACLTYYPFLTDTCPFHDANNCAADPGCNWTEPSGPCIHK